MTVPLIGVITARILNEHGLPLFAVNEAYTRALVQNGACPLMIPLGLTDTTISELISRLDGILFTGGGDVEPQRYGSNPHPLVTEVDPDRDRVEIKLLHEILQAKLPFLGICRGLQVINVALGGSLYEDILDQHPNALRHQCYPELPRNYLAHSIEIAPQSHLGRILGADLLQVNSLHHQGVRQLAGGLLATAYAPDGIIEALELVDYGFGLAVQWHPEWMADNPAMHSLFRAFVESATKGEKQAG